MVLQNMSILEKVNKLEGLIAKTELDVEYSISVAWLNGAEEDKNNAKVAIKNARTMFASNRIDQLDMDVRAATIANYNALLDTYLKMFPEYINDEEITETVERHM